MSNTSIENKMLLLFKNLKKRHFVFFFSSVMIFTFMIHSTFQYLYYKQCSRNLFLIFFMKESFYCKSLYFINKLLEDHSFEFLKNAFSTPFVL